MKVTLSIVAGPMSGQKKVFEEPDFFMVGRQEDCHYHLADDPYLSRHHFLLEINPPDIALRDLGSLNGTFVNGTRHGGRGEQESPEKAKQNQQLVVLKDGDLLKLGMTEIRVGVEMPVVCMECGNDIPMLEQKAAQAIGDSYICRTCLKKADEAKKEKMKAPAPILQKDVRTLPQAPDGRIQSPAAPKSPLPEPAKPRADAGKENEVRRFIAQNQKQGAQNPGNLIDLMLKQILLKGLDKKEPKETFPTIAGYSIQKKLGAGGFGAVYQAVHQISGKTVALKTMLQTKNPSKRNYDMFMREITVNRDLKHPNIITFENFGNYAGILFFALELMDGGSAWDLMAMGLKPIPLNDAIPIMLQSLEGLAFAHSKKIIHRDLKPPNLLLSRKNGQTIAKVSDFGLAKNFRKAGMTANRITEAGSFCGSPPYIAPEHISNYRFLKPETDVFEMAATFYHMLTGRTVWNVTGQNFIDIILKGAVTPIQSVKADIPKKIAKAINQALERAPEKRFADAGRFLKAMKKAV